MAGPYITGVSSIWPGGRNRSINAFRLTFTCLSKLKPSDIFVACIKWRLKYCVPQFRIHVFLITFTLMSKYQAKSIVLAVFPEKTRIVHVLDMAQLVS